jgi:hypothetical protein
MAEAAYGRAEPFLTSGGKADAARTMIRQSLLLVGRKNSTLPTTFRFSTYALANKPKFRAETAILNLLRLRQLETSRNLQRIFYFS